MNRLGIVCLLIATASCASVPSSGQGTISGLSEVAQRRDHCISVFEERLARTVDGGLLGGGGDELARQVLDLLPATERALIQRVSARKKLAVGEVDREMLYQLRKEFARENICGTDVPEFDVDIFADQLNQRLYAKGVNMKKAFWPAGASEFEKNLLLLTLLRVAE